MSRYQVNLSPELSETYCAIAKKLNIPVEQVLASAIQIYAEHLTLETYQNIYNTEQIRGLSPQYKEA